MLLLYSFHVAFPDPQRSGMRYRCAGKRVYMYRRRYTNVLMYSSSQEAICILPHDPSLSWNIWASSINSTSYNMHPSNWGSAQCPMTQITRIAVMLPLPSCFGGAVSCRIGETTKPQGVLLDCFVNISEHTPSSIPIYSHSPDTFQRCRS
jgi:hypothetical protein